MSPDGTTECRGTGSGSGIRPDPQQDRGIEILCAFDERFVPHAATMLCSLLENNRVFRVHIFHGASIGYESDRFALLMAKLKSLINRYACAVVCYEVRTEDFLDLRVDEWSSMAHYFRLAAPRLLPLDVKKVLYLDSDLVVRRSLQYLWNTDLRGYALAAVEDAYWDSKAELPYANLPDGAKYFNSGVMLINLEYWRQHNICEKAIDFIKHNPTKANYYDQDALNVILINRWVNLPATWNQHMLDPAIVHFVGDNKPWRWPMKHAFKLDYHRYRRKTPWPRYRLEGKPRIFYDSLRGSVWPLLPGRLRQRLRQLLTNFGT